MNIKLNDIFNLTKEEIRISKFELNTHASHNKELYINDWLQLSSEEKEVGETSHSFYLWSDPKTKQKHKFKAGDLVFSFFSIDAEKTEWLFVSAARITGITNDKDEFKPQYKIAEKFKPFFGRLIIECKRSATRIYCFKGDTIIERCVVKEILPDLYSGTKQ